MREPWNTLSRWVGEGREYPVVFYFQGRYELLESKSDCQGLLRKCQEKYKELT